MRSIKFYILAGLLTLSIQTKAQPDLDSLRSVWNNEQLADSIRMMALNGLIWNGYLYSQPDSAYILSENMIALDMDNEYPAARALGLGNQAVSFAIRGMFPEALEHFGHSMKCMEEIGDPKGVAMTLGNMGNVYDALGEYPRALDCFHQSLKINEEIGEQEGIAAALSNIGRIYSDHGEFDVALEYSLRALQIDEELGNSFAIAASHAVIGDIYQDNGDLAKALEYHSRSLEINEQIGELVGLANALGNIGLIHMNQEEYSTALEYLIRNNEVSEQLNDQRGIAISLGNIGDIHSALGEHGLALEYWHKSQKVAASIGFLTTLKKNCERLYRSYKTMGNSRKALEYLEQYKVYEDSLNETETAKKLQRMEFDKELLADSLRQEEEKYKIELAHQEEVAQKDKTRNMLMGGGLLLLLVAGGLFSRNRYVNRSRKAIQKEKDRSEELLLNILPEEVAEELKEKGEAEAQLIDLVTVLFTDFKGFTAMSEKLSPKELVDDLNTCFSEFDRITAKYGIEKIKTIGDAYMAAGGLPTPNTTHATDVIKAALEMRDFVEAGKARKIEAGLPYFEIRIGVHTGPVVAGIVGVKKFQYDIWGDTVNTASRMESSGEVGRVNISEATYELVKDDSEFDFTYRGKVEAKGKGELEMYFVKTT
ncbi:MAG: tetratricopeptide repeat protein [Flavobacteriales bacterium]|nr:tetratricopeptide repeat protein [Flavobacteriales bacterium]